MKKSILALLVGALLVFGACATIPCKQGPCPSENIIIFVEPGVPIAIPKGFFDNENNYFTEEEFKKALEDVETSI